MRVLFAPDWRDGVPYQRLLADALTAEGVQVDFLRNYRRILPLRRLVRDELRRSPVDLLHLHWPEAYYPPLRDGLDWFRCARFRLDLRLATRCVPHVLTAHNLLPHHRSAEPFARRNARTVARTARVVFAHSAGARTALVEAHALDPARVCIVPHGDLAAAMPGPIPRAEARARCNLGTAPVVLVFGAIEPYKGIEEVLEQWRQTKPDVQLVIAGKAASPEYEATIRAAAAGVAKVTLRLERLSDVDLACWLSAVDVVLFNYRAIFTSGAASLARSWGVPILFPARFTTVDLGEPDPSVCRYADFGRAFTLALRQALLTPPDFQRAASWRDSIAWSGIARTTAAAYRSALGR